MNDTDREETAPGDLPSHVRLRIAYYAACVAMTAVAVPFSVVAPFIWRSGFNAAGVALDEAGWLAAGGCMAWGLLRTGKTVRSYIRALRQDNG